MCSITRKLLKDDNVQWICLERLGIQWRRRHRSLKHTLCTAIATHIQAQLQQPFATNRRSFRLETYSPYTYLLLRHSSRCDGMFSITRKLRAGTSNWTCSQLVARQNLKQKKKKETWAFEYTKKLGFINTKDHTDCTEKTMMKTSQSEDNSLISRTDSTEQNFSSRKKLG
jgi:hypothetical protein